MAVSHYVKIAADAAAATVPVSGDYNDALLYLLTTQNSRSNTTS